MLNRSYMYIWNLMCAMTWFQLLSMLLWYTNTVCCHHIYVAVYTSARMVSYEVLRDYVISKNKDGRFPVWCVIHNRRLYLLFRMTMHNSVMIYYYCNCNIVLSAAFLSWAFITTTGSSIDNFLHWRYLSPISGVLSSFGDLL